MEQEKIELIKGKLRESADAFINCIADESIQDLFRKFSFIAGGAIASLVLDEEPNDLDFYFKDTYASYKVASYYIEKMNAECECRIEQSENGLSIRVPHGVLRVEKQADEKYQPLVVTSNAISLSDKVQIVTRFADSADKIAENFDFLHTKGIYDYANDQLILHDDVIAAIQQKRLTYTGSEYPLASLIRSRKFLKREWSINAGQYLKMAIEISKLDLSDPVVLKEQLVGVDLLIFDAFLRALEEKNKGEMDETTFEEKFDNLFDLIDEAFDKVRSKNQEENFDL